jgi:hypothetical protein
LVPNVLEALRILKVCEAHDDRPWDSGVSERACKCGVPGMQCPSCNRSDPLDTSRMGFRHHAEGGASAEITAHRFRQWLDEPGTSH